MKILKRFFKTIKGIFRRKKKKKSRRPARRPAQHPRKIHPRPQRKQKRVAKNKRMVARKPAKQKKPKKVPAAKPASVKTKSATPDRVVFVGDITHYFSKIMVCVVKVQGPLTIKDRIRIKGSSTDFTQTVGSMQIESVDVKSTRRGQLIGLKLTRVARPGDKVFKISPK